jgi:hypothetical protein
MTKDEKKTQFAPHTNPTGTFNAKLAHNSSGYFDSFFATQFRKLRVMKTKCSFPA